MECLCNFIFLETLELWECWRFFLDHFILLIRSIVNYCFPFSFVISYFVSDEQPQACHLKWLVLNLFGKLFG